MKATNCGVWLINIKLTPKSKPEQAKSRQAAARVEKECGVEGLNTPCLEWIKKLFFSGLFHAKTFFPFFIFGQESASSLATFCPKPVAKSQNVFGHIFFLSLTL